MRKPRVRTIDEIIALVSLSYGSNSKEVELVRKAYEYANSRFVAIDKRRNSGEPYMNHCLRVAWELANIGRSAETTAAALLHDTPEDIEDCSIEDIKREFGEVVARRVDGVTKYQMPDVKDKNGATKEQKEQGKKKAKDDTLVKLIVSSVDDPDTVDIKIFDRLDNMRDLDFKIDEHCDEEDCEKRKEKDRLKKKEISVDTREIYAPIADFRGAGRVRIELEDLALKQLDRKAYYRLKRSIAAVGRSRNPELKDMFVKLQKLINQENMVAEMVDKARHVYVAYQEEQRGISPAEMDDLLTIKVMVGSVEDCYKLAKLISENFIEIKRLRKDLISVPKMNLYQSLHMTVYGKDGHPFQIQIKTFEMDLIASFGNRKRSIEELRELAEMNKNNSNTSETAAIARKLFLRGEVIARTVDNDPILLRGGSTGPDFAEKIHTGILWSMTGVKINGVKAPLDQKIETGDVVEIVTNRRFKMGDQLPRTSFILNRNSIARTRFLEKLEEAANTPRVKTMIRREIARQAK